MNNLALSRSVTLPTSHVSACNKRWVDGGHIHPLDRHHTNQVQGEITTFAFMPGYGWIGNLTCVETACAAAWCYHALSPEQ